MYFSIALMVIVQVALAIFPESVHGSGHRDGHAGENLNIQKVSCDPALVTFLLIPAPRSVVTPSQSELSA